MLKLKALEGNILKLRYINDRILSGAFASAGC